MLAIFLFRALKHRDMGSHEVAQLTRAFDDIRTTLRKNADS